MSLFVDQSPAIEIRLKFRMIPDGGIEFINSDSEETEFEEIVCACKGRDFDTFSRVLEDSTIFNHVTGNSMVRTRNFYRSIVCNFVKAWNLKDEKTEKQIPITPEVVGRMHDEIPRFIARTWLGKTGRNK